MRVSNVDVTGLSQSIIAASYPFKTETPIDDDFDYEVDKLDHSILFGSQGLVPHARNRVEKSLIRAGNLAQTPKGSAHDQFLTGINVSFDLECTNKMWVEMERYRFVFFVSSQSTMHRMDKFDFDTSYIEYVDSRVIDIMKDLKAEYDRTGDREDFFRLIYTNPAGFKLTARLTTNYRSLKTIYSQRRGHKLKEWQDFCKWIETLPLAEELIIGRD